MMYRRSILGYKIYSEMSSKIRGRRQRRLVCQKFRLSTVSRMWHNIVHFFSRLHCWREAISDFDLERIGRFDVETGAAIGGWFVVVKAVLEVAAEVETAALPDSPVLEALVAL